MTELEEALAIMLTRQTVALEKIAEILERWRLDA